ncbi:Uncharacterised protein [Candidatus Ornithobacterium hominis]|uniref:Uncharacterized protein n=1 Tax=Candidatus Ornithobacterium hominis TaxID=2497989 RepID=A0A383U1U1_9FLAO|nr:hypothetical protein [Candidatus Ornithobacterium hominis]MCT7904747.1 hypothetical protein [Candidatus Ornithobacterium hominis]CAI9429875.1 Bacteriocin-type signal sequence [Candidatus Ornithobacterium hominis]SZD73902.1 Uncharacterised protein [Candidatus Ornithobacterium hominis]
MNTNTLTELNYEELIAIEGGCDTCRKVGKIVGRLIQEYIIDKLF